jgi:hypothetical protein
MESTADPDAPITAVEARNVVDGLAFIEHLEKPGTSQSYPYDIAGLPALTEFTDTTALSAAEIGAAIEERVERMRNTNDAVADVAMAESVFQIVKGNYDRAAGTLDAFSKGNFPPTPDVVLTPRSGKTLVHRVALHLEGGINPGDAANVTPRSKGEPALNRWLARHLPPMADIFAAIEYFDHASATTRRLTPSMAGLGLEPIDLFYLIDEGSARDMAGLDDVLIHHAMRQAVSPPRADTPLTLLYKPDGVPGYTLFEVAPLLRSLRGFVLGSRPLKPTDVMLASEATAQSDAAIVPRPEKVTAVLVELQAKAAPILAVTATLDAAVGEGVDDGLATTAALAHLDQWSNDYADALRQAWPFGLRAASLTTPFDQARPVFARLRGAVDALVDRWEGKLQEFTDTLTTYDALPPATPEEELFPVLIRAGRILSTAIVAPLPPHPSDLRLTMPGVQTAFETALGQLRSIRDSAERLGAFYAAVSGFVPMIADHDQTPLELEEFPRAILAIARDLAARSGQAAADLLDRAEKANTVLASIPAVPASKQAELAGDAMHAVLGDNFIVLPEFTLAAPQRAEWQNAWADRAALLAHLTPPDTINPFPVDDWLHGLGRTREKLRNLEMAGMLGEALAAPDTIELTPLQFPYRTQDAWLGLKFPATMPDGTPFHIDGDRLLYTAHFAAGAEIAPADASRRYCGFLLDEWSELIPGTEENTGLAFHYDRPSSEAPQAILLALPPEFTGSWKWDDLVATLHETLDFAKLRAVEPSQVDTTKLSRFLPAVVSAVTTFPITAMLNFSYNNALNSRLEAGNG